MNKVIPSEQAMVLKKAIEHVLALIDENIEHSNVLVHGVRGILARAADDIGKLPDDFLAGKRVVRDPSGRIIGAQG